MLEFVHALEKMVLDDPRRSHWELGEIAKQCDYPCHQVFECINVALGEDVDARAPLTRSKLLQVLVILKEKTRPQFMLEQKRLMQQQQKIRQNYEAIMTKIRGSQKTGDWRKAYRSLSYFAGSYAQELPYDLQLVLFNDCLRLGVKARINLQELGNWLRRVVEETLKNPTNDALVDAIDFFDTYQDEFLSDKTGLGSKLLKNIARPLKEKAITCNVPLNSLLTSVG